MADPEPIPTPEPMPTEVYLEIGGPPRPEGPAPSWGSPATAPLAPGMPGQPLEAQPPFGLEAPAGEGEAAPAPAPGPVAPSRPFTLPDSSTVPPEYWIDLQRGYDAGDVSTDDYYQLHRQRTEDEENPLLRELRGAPPAAGGPAAPPSPAPAAPSAGPPPTPSTTEQLSAWLSGIGLKGLRPVQPVGTLIEAVAGDLKMDPKNPVYLAARGIAKGMDLTLSALNVPFVGLQDLGNLVLSPMTVLLRQQGFPEKDVQGFVESTRTAVGTAAMAATMGVGGAVGQTLGAVAMPELGPMTAAAKEIAARAGRQIAAMDVEAGFAATMRNVWKSERGEVRIPGPDGAPINPEVLRPTAPDTLAAKYQAAVIEARRGGPRSLEQVAAEGQALIDQGLVSMDTIRLIKPGAVLNDAETWATMRLLADEGLRVKALAKLALLDPSPERLGHMLEQFYTFSLTLGPKGIGVEAEAGRSLNVWNEPLSGFKRFLTQFEEQARNTTTGTTGLTVARAIDSFENPEQLAVFARQATKPGFWDFFNEYYVNGLLWGPKSWAANFLGNTITTAWSIPERKLAEWVSGPRGVQAGEAWELMHGVLGSVLDGWRLGGEAGKAGLKALRTGESHYREFVGLGADAGAVDKMELVRRRVISSETLELSGPIGAAVDFMGAVVNVPRHVLTGTDDFFKVALFRGEQRALALREAREEALAEGLTGKAFATYVDARINQKMADPPVTIQRGADKFALYNTLQAELGRPGKLVKQISNLPAGKILLPIVQTPVNAAKWVGERTLLMLLNARFRREVTGDDPAVAALAKAKVTLGSLTMAIGALWYWNGTITSGGPSDPKIRQDLMDNLNWRPYAAKIGGTYVGLNRLEPPGMLLSLAADFADAVLNGDEDDQEVEWEEAANAAVIATAKNFTSRTWVQSMSRTMAAISDPERMSESVLSHFLTSLIPLSGLVRQTEQVLDPAMREADGVMQRLRANTAGLSTTVKPRLTLDGDVVYQTGVWGPISITRMKDDPVARERIKVGARIPEIPKTIGRGPEAVRLTGAERHYWALQRGKMEVGAEGWTVRQRQAATIASEFYRTSSDEIKAFLLERDILLHQQEALLATYEKYPNLKDAVEERRIKRMEKKFGGPTPEQTTPLLKSLLP